MTIMKMLVEVWGFFMYLFFCGICYYLEKSFYFKTELGEFVRTSLVSPSYSNLCVLFLYYTLLPRPMMMFWQRNCHPQLRRVKDCALSRQSR